MDRIRIGISSCLLGAEVRFDGGHKWDPYINETLARYFELVPVCPEVGIGLGTPREPIRLVRLGGGIRARGVEDASLDVTDRLVEFAHAMSDTLGGISGYLFKRGSPSCGMGRAKIHAPDGMPVGHGAGVYARVIMERCPLLPCADEGRLADPGPRENFIERVFVYRRWQELVAGGLSPGKLVAFHTDHEYLVLARNPSANRRMGKLIARAGTHPLAELADEYVTELMAALERGATGRRRVNAARGAS